MMTYTAMTARKYEEHISKWSVRMMAMNTNDDSHDVFGNSAKHDNHDNDNNNNEIIIINDNENDDTMMMRQALRR